MTAVLEPRSTTHVPAPSVHVELTREEHAALLSYIGDLPSWQHFTSPSPQNGSLHTSRIVRAVELERVAAVADKLGRA